MGALPDIAATLALSRLPHRAYIRDNSEMSAFDPDAKGLFQVIDGRPAMEPKLPPFHLCGGLLAPYYPGLTDQELKAILSHPDILPSAAQYAWRELGDRRRRIKRIR
jgi:hypothetical protein